MTGVEPWSPGYAFHSPRTAPDGGHLWGVFSIAIGGEVFIANVTTARPDSDRACVLRPGDHPRIRHESRIHYAASRFVAVDQLASLRGLRIVEAFSAEVVQRVLQGALASEETSLRAKSLLRKLAGGPETRKRGEDVREAQAATYG